MKKTENFECYKKIDAEEYKIIEKNNSEKSFEFNKFPCDGLWMVSSKKNSRTTSFLFEIKKEQDLPIKYPLVELALRKDDISHAIMNFIEGKEKTLLDLGKCSYSFSEMSDYIIKYLVNQEYGGGSKKVLTEKQWIKIEDKK